MTLRPIESPALWRGDELQHAPEKWLHVLTPAEIAELRDAADAIARSGKPLARVEAHDFAPRALAPLLADVRARLERGLGFVLLRGVPVREIGKEASALGYYWLGLQLGVPVSQNTSGDLLGHVRDTGAKPSDHDVRLYKTRAELAFHTDGADIIGLLCLRSGRSGGVSRIASSPFVFNEIVRRRPDLAPLLLRTYQHHAHGQYGPNGPKTFGLPIVALQGSVFRMLLLTWYIRNAAQDFPEIAGLDGAQRELLDLLEAIPQEPGVALDMSFQPGDVQLLKNSVILHARTEYQDWDEPDEKRHLLRLWLSQPSFADGDEGLRRGIAKRDAA
jgi:Taurine catabolism dioxygenase TauD, TfdA family